MFRLTCKNETVDVTEEEEREIIEYLMKLFVLREKKDE